MEKQLQTDEKMNGTVDIVKLIFAVLVIGIHAEPFAFHFWLDKGYGLISRLCVPFFFIASAFFFWKREKPVLPCLKRFTLLYLLWVILYLPLDYKNYSLRNPLNTLKLLFWNGTSRVLWYLWASVIGFLITYLLLKILKPKHVLLIAFAVLFYGTLKSTYATALSEIGIRLPDVLGYRNGLYYAFPYVALGMFLAKLNPKKISGTPWKFAGGTLISFALLCLESLIFAYFFRAGATVLWLSVFPLSAFFFLWVINTKIEIKKEKSLFIRKMSILMYLGQHLFITLLGRHFHNMMLFLLTASATAAFSAAVIWLSERKPFRFLHFLY